MKGFMFLYIFFLGRDCLKIYDEIVSGRTRTTSTGEEPPPERIMIDPRRRLPSYEKPTPKMPESDLNALNKVKRDTPRSFSADIVTPASSEFGYGTESLHSSRLSERSLSLQSDTFHSTHSTPSNISYDSGFGYKYGIQNPVSQNKPSSNSHVKSNVWDKRSAWNESPSLWEDSSSPAWDNHRNAKRHVTPPSTPVTPVPKQSPIRESLDSRIELLLKQNDGKNLFLDLGAVSAQIGDVSLGDSDRNLMGPPLPWTSDAPPLPPDSSPLPPLPESDEPPPPPPEEEDDLVLLSTPPSPFLSFSEYHKWAVITSDIDSGKLTSLSDIANREDAHLEHPIPIKGVRLSSINWKANSMPLEKPYDSPIIQDKGDSTPVRDELPIEDDDKMSLSSLSDGENKLELHVPNVPDNTATATPQKTVNHGRTSSVAPPNFNSIYSSQNTGPNIYPVSDAPPYSAAPPPPHYPPNFPNSGSGAYPPTGPASAASTAYPPPGPSNASSTAYPPPGPSTPGTPAFPHSGPTSASSTGYPPTGPTTAGSGAYPPAGPAAAGSSAYPAAGPTAAGSPAFPPSGPTSAASTTYPPPVPPPPPPPTGTSLYTSTPSSQFPAQGVFANPLPPATPASVAPTSVPPPPRPPLPFISQNPPQSQGAPSSHPMHPSEHVQMMARMGIWRPGMGSGISNTTTSAFSGRECSQTPFTPGSFYPPRQPLPGTAFSSSPVPFTPPSNIAEMITRPPPGYPALPVRPMVPNTAFPLFPSSQFTVPPPDIRDPHAPTVNGVLACITKEMKQVMKKDICKRMVEVTAFKRFEQWWDEQVHQEKVFFNVLIFLFLCLMKNINCTNYAELKQF